MSERKFAGILIGSMLLFGTVVGLVADRDKIISTPEIFEVHDVEVRELNCGKIEYRITTKSGEMRRFLARRESENAAQLTLFKYKGVFEVTTGCDGNYKVQRLERFK
jgi:hypothetical protein